VGLTGSSFALLAQMPPGPPNQEQAPLLPPQQLDNLVAPVALYPDPLLGQVLVASTYPLELVEAQQWLQANRDLSGPQLTDAARQQNWDASVQAMVATPEVLARLTQDIRWTTDLGNAFLAQQGDVMNAVQRMRSRAMANGRLRSNPQENVTTERQDGQAAIQIIPANPQVIYVPVYDPAYVWGPPLWGYYPPLVYPGFGLWFGPGINIGFFFGGWGGWGWGSWGWGWGPNWFGRGVFLNASFFNHYGYRGYGGGSMGRMAWSHDPGHRLGVSYPNRQLSSRFGAASQASRMAAGRSVNSQGMRQGGFGSRNSSPGGASQAGARSSESSRASSGWQRFDSPQQGGQASAQRTTGSQSRYSTQGQGYPSAQSSQRSYQSSPRSYQSPQRSSQAAPRASASRPSSGGGSYRSSGGGGGGGSHSSGGGARSAGSSHSGGGGSHSGRR
jgi:hypothetical protein